MELIQALQADRRKAKLILGISKVEYTPEMVVSEKARVQMIQQIRQQRQMEERKSKTILEMIKDLGLNTKAELKPDVISPWLNLFSKQENWIFVPFSNDSNDWVHIAVVADGSRIKGYLNGVQQFDIPHPNWPSENGDWFYSDGTLDEVLLYSEALWTADFTPPDAPFTY